jgi:hypothetical protein
MPRLLLIGGLAAMAIFFALAVGRGSNGHPAPAQSDAMVYMQYARAMAEGHPYAFTAGDAPSTGSTSHLYPAVLALFHLIGARGEALFSVAFLFNALCYLAWLQLVWLVAQRVVPRQAAPAALLVLLNGHLAMTAAGMTDMPLFTLLAWGLLAAVLLARFRLAAALAALCVLARPEGMVLAAGLALLAVFLRWRGHADARRLATVAACGLAAVAGVFALNLALTGMAQFQSVSQKGYFHLYPWIGALGNTTRDLVTLVRELLFNMGGVLRQAYFLPVAGGLLALLGLTAVARPGAHAAALRWWLLCGLAALGLVAASEWQGVGSDRYLLWILPSWYLLAVGGADEVGQALRLPRLTTLLLVVMAGFELATWPGFASRFAADCVRSQSVASFAASVDTALPPEASVGTIAGAGAAYRLGSHAVRHLVGITSPAFARQRDRYCAVEMLKHRPENRFTHLLVNTAEQQWCATAGLLGEPLLVDVDAPPTDEAYTLCAARWDAFPAAALEPLDPAISNAVTLLTLVDRLDVGFVPDERRTSYHVGSRLPDQVCAPCVAVRNLGGVRAVEVGQVVIGWDEFQVHAPRPNTPLRVVLRTIPDATCTVIRASERFGGEGIHLRSPLVLRPIVNGRPLENVSLRLSADPDAFTECGFVIPAEYVDSDPLTIALAGDHIALAYWFYQ